MKIWLLTVESQDNVEHLCYSSKEKALELVKGDLTDRYHFDTDESYITREELKQKQEEAVKALGNFEVWDDDDVTYTLENLEVMD